MTTAFDFLKASYALRAAGVAPRQAETIIGTSRDAVPAGIATKADIANLQTEIADLR